MSISQKSAHQTHEAIVFFAGGEIGKEMLYTEFEALLDCVVPMRDFAGRDIQAAYVRLDGALVPVAVVLFMVAFDADGFPEQRWNVPLRQLADRGMRGPDLGGGPLRLATRSQCPLPGEESKLWDVQFGLGGNTLEQLRERLQRNRLGLDVLESRAPAPPLAPVAMAPAPAPAGAPAAPAPAATGASPDAMLQLMQQANQQIALIKEQGQRELQSMQQRLAELQQRAATAEAERLGLQQQLDEHARARDAERLGLQQQLDEHARTREDERQRAERTLKLAIEKARQQQEQLRQQLEAEHARAIAAAGAALGEAQAAHREELAARESAFAAELDGARAAALQALEEERARHRHETQLLEEQVHSLRGELTELRRDKLRLMGEGADKFFAQLKEKGVKFVAFQPGAGHLTIPMEDLDRYLEDTEAFVAAKCGVSVEHYLRWLAHYNSPVCQGTAGSGAPCAKPLQKMLKPSEFVAGMHDRCDIHKQVPRSPAAKGPAA